MAISYDNILKESEEFYKKQQEQALADKNATFDQQVNTLNQNYDFAVKNANAAYEDKYRENAIQKLVNERQVAENMANMGTTNSGLNRTQQTAVQLSYANQKAALDRQKQQQVDTLERERTSSLTDIESNRSSALDSVSQYYTGLKQDMANSRYNTDVTAETERVNAQVAAEAEAEKARIEAANKLALAQQELAAAEAKALKLAEINNTAEYNKELALKQLEYDNEFALKQLEYDNETAKATSEKASYIISTNGGLLSRNFTGTLADNGINVYQDDDGNYVYVDNNSGKKTTLPKGTNPFTGTVNEDVKYGTFSNGYQPNNINGTELIEEDAKINVDGNEQSVWAANDKYYFWKGKENKYLELTESEIEELGLPTM